MKILTIFALCFALFTAASPAQTNATAAASTNAPADPNIRALVKLLVARREAMLRSSRLVIDRNQITQMQIHAGDFSAALKGIDTSALPTPLRLAWFDYVSAWETRASAQGREGSKVLLDVIGMGSGHPALAFSALNTLVGIADEKQGTHEAWLKFERASLELGYDLTRPLP